MTRQPHPRPLLACLLAVVLAGCSGSGTGVDVSADAAAASAADRNSGDPGGSGDPIDPGAGSQSADVTGDGPEAPVAGGQDTGGRAAGEQDSAGQAGGGQGGGGQGTGAGGQGAGGAGSVEAGGTPAGGGRPGGPEPDEGAGARPAGPFDVEAFENRGGDLPSFRETAASTCGAGQCTVVERITGDASDPSLCRVSDFLYDRPPRPEGAEPKDQFFQRGSTVVALITCPEPPAGGSSGGSGTASGGGAGEQGTGEEGTGEEGAGEQGAGEAGGGEPEDGDAGEPEAGSEEPGTTGEEPPA
jgi:hypothetical protein